jgi:hypothetical protein
VCGVQVQHKREVALRTLRIMAEDLDESHVPGVLEQVQPLVLRGIEAGGKPTPELRLALAVMASCVKSASLMESVARKQLRAVLQADLKRLVNDLCSVVSSPVPQGDSMCATRPGA